MKNLSFIFAVAILMAVTFVSCSKKDDTFGPQKQYASAISGQFIPQDGDITLKNAPLVGGHQINCYDKKTTGAPWTPVNGTEFLPGSLPALDWANYQINAQTWWLPGQVYITYCPVLPMRVVLKATLGAYGTAPSYLGIWEGTPYQGGFPITVQDRRLGDVLTLNTQALTNLPGYTNMSFEVVFNKSIIDIAGTEATSPVTNTAWPVYSYSSSPVTTVNLPGAVTGDRIVYDDVDAKITGTITIKIHVDNTTLTVSTPAAGMGQGLKITLSTTKVGWYDSGIIGVTENDITVGAVTVPVN